MIANSLRTMLLLPFALLLASLAEGDSQKLKPKMLAELVPPGRRLAPVSDSPGTETTGFMALIGDCSPSTPFTFPVSAGEGKGMVGFMDDTEASALLEIDDGSIALDTEKQFNVFSAITDGADDGTAGQRFTYELVSDDGATATLSCDRPVKVLVMTKDHSDLVLEYNVVTGKGRGNKAATSKVTLANRVAERPIQRQAFAKGQAGQRRLQSDVDFHDDSTSSIQYDDNGPGSVVLLQVEFKENGKKYYRSIITETELPPPDVGTFVLDSADVNDNGDLDLYFSGLPTGTVMLKAVILIELRNKAVPNGKIEITGIVDDGHLVVHGGWIRNALEGARETTNGSTNGWKLFVDEAQAYDTSGTTVLSRLGDKIEPVVAGDKQVLAHTPSADEKGISKDMIMGRRPVEEQPNDLRSRTLNTGLHKKILVHGYCASGNPWPQNQFSNFEVFSDPDARRQLGGGGGANNWSNDLFAQKILLFAQNKNLHGCGIIAHSQGGLAALHMYTYYWSCLDYASSPNRMIQSVGSPYLGTPLAGNLAALGNIFGAGCGSQNDLTTSGAAAWLSNIPSWARSQVHYYTTSFKDRWWAYDYCHLATDLLLSDPDDGTTERYRGQLSGGINRGHTTNQCHTTGMRDTAQYFDQSRNLDMNSNASV